MVLEKEMESCRHCFPDAPELTECGWSREVLTLPAMGSEAVSINSNPVWGSASRNGPWRQNRAQTIPEGFTADALEANKSC